MLSLLPCCSSSSAAYQLLVAQVPQQLTSIPHLLSFDKFLKSKEKGRFRPVNPIMSWFRSLIYLASYPAKYRAELRSEGNTLVAWTGAWVHPVSYGRYLLVQWPAADGVHRHSIHLDKLHKNPSTKSI
jgi:hypothetical protein